MINKIDVQTKFKYISYTLLFALAGCTSEEYFNCEPDKDDDGIIILQERNPKLPKTAVTRPIIKPTSGSRSDGGINSNERLGFSYAAGNSILGDVDNIGMEVIDLKKVQDLLPGYIGSERPRSFDSYKFAFSDYNTYESTLKQSKKIHSGFSIDLLGFKLGRKREHDKTFNSTITSSSNVVYGELDMLYKDVSFNLSTAGGAMKLYARECLASSFISNLFSSTIGSLIDAYGEYVITGYYTGGKACALFAGLDNSSASQSQRENNLLDDINASFKWDENKSIGGNYNFGKNKGDSTSYTYHTQSLYTKLLIYGGTPFGISLNGADKIDNINLDLTQWVTSLSNPATHTIVDFKESGLYSLSDLISEANFKRRFDDTASEILYPFPHFITPYIEITRVFVRYSSTGEALYDIAPVLLTRQGDRIVLHRHDPSQLTDAELRTNESAEVFNQKALEIKQQVQDYYELEIRSNSVKRLNPIVGNPLCMDLGVVTEGEMAIYENPRTGINYIYDFKRKIAFSYLVDIFDGDMVLDVYGIRNWVESLPHKSVNIASLLSTCTIIGL